MFQAKYSDYRKEDEALSDTIQELEYQLGVAKRQRQKNRCSMTVDIADGISAFFETFGENCFVTVFVRGRSTACWKITRYLNSELSLEEHYGNLINNYEKDSHKLTSDEQSKLLDLILKTIEWMKE
jgi:hypothetical protein